MILGLIAINEYMRLVKKQQLDRAETAAIQMVSVANSIGDAIYEPMAMIERAKGNSKDQQEIRVKALQGQATEIQDKWRKETDHNNHWVTLQTFYNEPILSAVCGMSRPPITQSQTFLSCLKARQMNYFNNEYRSVCRCVNQKIGYAGFINMIPAEIDMQPIWGEDSETPKSVLLRVPYPELGGEVDSGLALRMLAHLKRHLVDTPQLKFAVCMGELKNPYRLPSNPFACETDVETSNYLEKSNQSIYIHIERKDYKKS